VARGVLEARGIRCCVSAEDTGYDIAFATGGAKLLVERGDAETALDILRSAQADSVGNWIEDETEDSTTDAPEFSSPEVKAWSPIQFNLRRILIVIGAFAALSAIFKYTDANISFVVLLLALSLWLAVCCIRLVMPRERNRDDASDPSPPDH
jgi:hypothetical protein